MPILQLLSLESKIVGAAEISNFSRLMILHASELETELFDEVQSPRCTFATSIATAKLISVVASRAGYYQYKMASNI